MTTLYVAKTPTGAKVERREYDGMADGIFAKGYTRYFYDDDCIESAKEYAEREAAELDGRTVELSPAVAED